jgi:hypothetical protein
VVFVVALTARLAMLAALPTLRDPENIDPDSYHSLARHLAAGEGFVAPNERGEILPSIARPPVYPLFLAMLMKLGGDELRLFFATQCVIGAVTSALTVFFAARWLPVRFATVAGLMVALDPNSVIRCVDLMTETVFTLVLVAGACMIAWRTAGSVHWCIAGLLWSLAALCRPIAAWLWLIAVAVLLVSSEMTWRARAVCWFAFLIGFFPPLGLWMARNAQLTGHCFLSTIATHNLLWYRAASVEAERTATRLDDVQRRFYEQCDDVQFFDDRTQFERKLCCFRQTAFSILRSSPFLMAKQAVHGWAMLLLGPGTRTLPKLMHSQPSSARWWPPIYAALLACVVVASVLGATRLRRACVLPVALVAYFVVLAGGPEANNRFRAPITPILATLAMAGVQPSRRKE